MVFTRRSVQAYKSAGFRSTAAPSTSSSSRTRSSDDGDVRSTTSSVSSLSLVSSSSSSLSAVRLGIQGTTASGSSSGGKSTIMTRKRRLIQQTEADLAIGVAPYWEGGVVARERNQDFDGRAEQKDGHPRRSRRGEARRRYEIAAGVSRVHEKLAVNLPPMVSTREGKLLAVEVFGDHARKHLPAADKGPRVGHCSSGYVCGHPVPRGKEGNLWCQTPVKALLSTKMACMHHQHQRLGNGWPTKDQKRHMLLAAQFYDKDGELCWLQVVSHLRSFPTPLEEKQRKQVITTENRAFALSDVTIVLHGFRQCTMFWLAVCRLTRRGYPFTMVAHSSKTEFRDFITDLRNDTSIFPPPKQVSSPFVCITDLNFRGACYYANGYEDVCRMF